MDNDAIFYQNLVLVAAAIAVLFVVGLGIYRRFRLVYRRHNRRDIEAAALRALAEEQQAHQNAPKGYPGH